MIKLRSRKNPLTFETEAIVYERGHYREVIIAAGRNGAQVRLKKSRGRLFVTWEGIYVFAAKLQAEAARAEKAAGKAARKAVRR